MAGEAITSSDTHFVFDTWFESVAVTVNRHGPTLVGVPDKTPVTSSSERPDGTPLELNEYPPDPPVAANVALYGAFWVAFGSAPSASAPVTVRCTSLTLRLKPRKTVSMPSFNCTPKLNEPETDGVPEINPLELSDSPAGHVPV